MKFLNIGLAPWSLEGALQPSYDHETDYVTLDNRIHETWPFGVNIDNLVILDFNKNRVLASVEILIPYRLWKRRALPLLHAKSERGSLMLPEIDSEKTIFVLPDCLEVYLEANTQIAQVAFGTFEEPLLVVTLSETCTAIISRGELLVGFRFKFSAI